MPVELIAPWALLVVSGVLAPLMSRLARRRRQGGDPADYWTVIAAWYLFPLGALLLLSRILASLPGWPGAWHLYLDAVAGAPPWAFWLALLLPFCGWGLALVAALRLPPADPATARWLAGGIGFGNSRRWLLWCVLPLLLIALFEAGELGGGASAYPAALWSTLVVSAATLAAIALGAAPAAARSPAAGTAPAPELPPQDWPGILEAAGIRSRILATWPAGDPPRPPRGERVEDLARRLDDLGARGVAPELVEAMAALLGPEPPGGKPGPIRLIFAPDDCGQVETVCAAASLLGQEADAITLVVAAEGIAHLAARLRCGIPAEDRGRIAMLDQGDPPPDALLWVADAEYLSDRLLPLLQQSAIVRRIGLVVWWDLQDYSGVMAANLWAITRRLYRLADFHGRDDIRTLALVRDSRADAQLSHFVRHILPHPFPPETEVHVAVRCRHPVVLHRLEPPAGNRANPAEAENLLLKAAAVSVAGGWASFLRPPENLSATELGRFLQAPVAGGTLGARLSPSPAEAGARLMEIGAAEVLALPAMLCQGGRAGPAAPHHVGLAAPANPYAAYLLDRLAQGRELPASRRLVSASANPAIVQRHLLLALAELPDTRQGLLQATLWDETRVGETLNSLQRAGQLTRREVRYLNDTGRLVRDWEYRSRRPVAGVFRPLDTVGLKLLEVRERAGDADDGGVRLWIDPERVLIKAYPGRVFMRRGRRYRVRDWRSLPEALARRWLECQKDDQPCLTWRIHNSVVFRARPMPGKAAATIGRADRLNRRAVQIRYEEEVIGRIEFSLAAPHSREPRITHYERPLTQSFDTRALILGFMKQPPHPGALPSLRHALRSVLPVHLGVADDALEVVALNGDMILGEETHGLAIVDLYPNGIGLIDAIHDDNAFLLELLGWTRDWLKSCADQDLETPAALAADGDFPLDRGAALSLLETLV